MEVISLCPLPVAGLLWSTEQRGWSLTIVCKATYRLAPGELKLETNQIGLNRTDRHYDDEPMCSVYAPADLAPFKPRIDVVVVGHGYATTKTSQVVTARLEVGEVKKALRVYGARLRDADGKKGPTATFKKVALRYERGAGGPATVNPVGIPTHGTPEQDGSYALPNLELADDQEGSGFSAFGAIAASWPSRRKKLGRHADALSIRSWWEAPFPAELDLSFFNCAPDDQQLDVLKAGDVIKLRNVHEEHALLEVTIPKLAPQAFLEIFDGEDEILNMRCDTVWIDTDQDLLTLTWRGHLRLDEPDVCGRCIVAASHDGKTLSKEDIRPLLDNAGIGDVGGPPSLGGAIGLAGAKAATTQTGRLLEVQMVDVPGAASSSSGDVDEDARSATARSEGSDVHETMPPPSAPPSMLTSAEVMLIPDAQLESSPPSGYDGDVTRHGLKIVKLVWVDRSRVRAIRNGWRELLVSDARHTEDGPQKELRDVHRVFVSAYPASGSDIEGAVAEAVGQQLEFQSPLILSSGELRVSYDELALLRATVTGAVPFATGHFELEQLLTSARNLITAPWLRTADGTASELTLRIQETFSSAASALPPDFLAAQARRIVVSERCYQLRELWGRRWLRAAFTPVHAHVPFTVYLPEDVGDYLPLFDHFFARMIAHVDLREDQFETHPLVLKVCALARVVDSPMAFSGA